LQVCLDLGLMVPHFCYHEALGPAGACRLCAAMVAPSPDKPAQLAMTCMTRVANGMAVKIQDPYAKDFRRGVIEYLMLNHPHDCPVCDEGGECMLQDMTVLSEHIHRRSRFPKRTWRNQYLGPLIHHEMNRCITCYRCVRFYRDYALGKDLGVFGSRDRVYFGRVKDGVLESEFAGNLVDVCPTGVFTDKRFREVYARPWDLRTARAVCVHCSVGCNLLVGGRHRTLRRIKPAPHKELNRFFICDRGRFGGEYVNSYPRQATPMISGNKSSFTKAIEHAADQLRQIVEKYGPKAVVAFGSQRTSLETNAALNLLLRAAGAAPQIVYHDSDEEHATVRFASAMVTSRELPVPTLVDIEKCDVILSVGGDLTGEAPMIDLSVRQAIRAGCTFFVISPRAGKLDEFAKRTLRVRPDAIATTVEEVGRALAQTSEPMRPELAEIVEALRNARNPLILCSTLRGDLRTAEAVYQAAKVAHKEGRPCYLAYYFPSSNSVGVGLARDSMPPSEAVELIRAGKAKAVVVVERDLAAAVGGRAIASELLSRCEFSLIVSSVEPVPPETVTVWLPSLPHYLTHGKFVNYEGRAQYSDGLSLATPLTQGPADLLAAIITQLGQSTLLESAQYSEIYAIASEQETLVEQLSPTSEGVLLRTELGVGTHAERSHAAPLRGEWVRWQIIQTFGSEELSALSPPIAELSARLRMEMHPDDIEKQGLREGEMVPVPDVPSMKLKLVANAQLAHGTFAIPRLPEHLATDALAEGKA
ncbi:MAG: NADH-quinone oxidoreductase subunit NuoG, partial [Candidatus Sumerlaeaceae bacterium]